VIIKYSADGKDPQKWTWDPGSVLAAEAMAIEKRADCNWDEFRDRVLHGSTAARQVLLWHLLKHDHPNLKLADVTFRTGEVEVQMDGKELTKLRADIEQGDTYDDEVRTKLLERIDLELTKLEFTAVTNAEPEGKARSKKDTSATG
jgi:hypothetical protein